MSTTGQAVMSESRRLDSWKQIAQYLGRSSRTIQRWHEKYRMPVCQVGGPGGAVYAFESEVNAWMHRWEGGIAPPTPPEPVKEKEHVLGRVLSMEGRLLQSQAPNGTEKQAQRLSSSAMSDYGWELWNLLSEKNLPSIIHTFREAIDLNTRNVSALAGFAAAQCGQAILGKMREPTAYLTASAALELAEQAEPDHLDVRATRAWLSMMVKRDWKNAEAMMDAVLREDRTNSPALVGRGSLEIAARNFDAAQIYFDRLLAAKPLSPFAFLMRIFASYLSGNLDEAQERISEARALGHSEGRLAAIQALCLVQQGKADEFLDSLDSPPRQDQAGNLLCGIVGYAYAVTGKKQRARDILRDLAPGGPADLHHDPYGIALVHLGLGERREAAARLEQSYREGSFWSLAFHSDPMLEEMQSDGHFRALIGRLSYPSRYLRSIG